MLSPPSLHRCTPEKSAVRVTDATRNSVQESSFSHSFYVSHENAVMLFGWSNMIMLCGSENWTYNLVICSIKVFYLNNNKKPAKRLIHKTPHKEKKIYQPCDGTLTVSNLLGLKRYQIIKKVAEGLLKQSRYLRKASLVIRWRGLNQCVIAARKQIKFNFLSREKRRK